jgi:hypothetical protein
MFLLEPNGEGSGRSVGLFYCLILSVSYPIKWEVQIRLNLFFSLNLFALKSYINEKCSTKNYFYSLVVTHPVYRTKFSLKIVLRGEKNFLMEASETASWNLADKL